MVPALRDERERCPVTPARTLALNAELSNYAVKTIQVLQPEKLHGASEKLRTESYAAPITGAAATHRRGTERERRCSQVLVVCE